VNAAAEASDRASVLNYYKALIRLRKSNAALREGDFQLVNPEDPDVLSFVRRAPDGAAALIMLNCTAAPRTIAVRHLPEKQAAVLLSSFAPEGSAVNLAAIALPPYGALVARIAR
jgi:glycosidase